MTKRLRKGVMIRSKLCNKFNKSRTCVDLQLYKAKEYVYESSKKYKAAIL